jgi:hypothetical protein
VGSGGGTYPSYQPRAVERAVTSADTSCDVRSPSGESGRLATSALLLPAAAAAASADAPLLPSASPAACGRGWCTTTLPISVSPSNRPSSTTPARVVSVAWPSTTPSRNGAFSVSPLPTKVSVPVPCICPLCHSPVYDTSGGGADESATAPPPTAPTPRTCPTAAPPAAPPAAPSAPSSSSSSSPPLLP